MIRFHMITTIISVTLAAQTQSAARLDASNNGASIPRRIPRYAVTEPAWVTELLGPTMEPITTTTTRRPTLHDKILDRLKQVHTTINNIPNKINQIFGDIHKGAQNIITGPAALPNATSFFRPNGTLFRSNTTFFRFFS